MQLQMDKGERHTTHASLFICGSSALRLMHDAGGKGQGEGLGYMLFPNSATPSFENIAKVFMSIYSIGHFLRGEIGPRHDDMQDLKSKL